MELEFRKYDGSTVALNPRIERRGEALTMKLNEQNCDYFLLFSKMPGGSVDLQDKDIQNALMDRKDLFPAVQDETLTENVRFSCIEWSDYRVNDYAIHLSGRIAEYTVIGCRQDRDRLIIFVPDEGVSCTVSVSLPVSYHIYQAASENSRSPFARNVPQQAYFAVEFDKIPNYQDGGIIYRLDGIPWDYPVTGEMLARDRFFIEAGHGMPRFSATVSGLELKQS